MKQKTKRQSNDVRKTAAPKIQPPKLYVTPNVFWGSNATISVSQAMENKKP